VVEEVVEPEKMSHLIRIVPLNKLLIVTEVDVAQHPHLLTVSQPLEEQGI
jgi:hypothetical protein